jgi:hypothetical protein
MGKYGKSVAVYHVFTHVLATSIQQHMKSIFWDFMGG